MDYIFVFCEMLSVDKRVQLGLTVFFRLSKNMKYSLLELFSSKYYIENVCPFIKQYILVLFGIGKGQINQITQLDK